MAEDTIPRPIRFQFLERAQAVCDLAKLDYWEHTQVLSELREQMEATYRAYDQAGLYKDDAEAKTLEDFGSPQLIARIYRDGLRGLCHRLLFFKRYALHRLLSPIILCVLHSWLRAEGSLEFRVLSTENHEWRFLLNGWTNYLGLTIVLAAMATHLIPRHWKTARFVGNWVAVAVTLAVSVELGSDWYASVLDLLRHIANNNVTDNHSQWGSISFGAVLLGVFLLEAIAYLLILVLIAAEIFDLSDRRKNRIESRQRMLA